jgi:Na+/melibiose symporter-like transporter
VSRLAFAASGVPTIGLIANGIEYFLLFYYSHIVGLAPALAGLALAIALAFDAISDPLVGHLSDNFRSRLGRRHPFMYASIIPMSALYVLVWFPPFGPDAQGLLFAYLLAVAVLLRLSMTMFDVPVAAIMPELTTDYDERTLMSSLRISTSWITGSLISMAMYLIWLKDSPGRLDGSLNAAGYRQAALWGGAIVLASLIFSSAGLHGEIPRLKAQAASAVGGLRGMFRSLLGLLSNRSMRALLGSGLFLYIGTGTTAALWIYQYSYFYGFNSDQMAWLIVVQLAATFAVVPVVRHLVFKRDKKKMTIRLIVLSIAMSTVLPPLHVLGLLPSSGSNGLMYVLMVYDFSSQLVWIVVVSLIYSLYADVTEDMLLAAGERMEGMINSGQTFVSKSASGIGTMLAGALLSVIHFPADTESTEVPQRILAQLGIGYIVPWVLFACIAIWIISRYEITRALHEREVAALKGSERRAPD